MKTLADKQTTVDTLFKEFDGAAAIYLINYQGITVEKDNALRMNLRGKGIVYRAVKNTVLKRVLEKMGVSGLDQFLEGATSVMIGQTEDPMMPARELVDFHKANPDFLSSKCITLDGNVLPGSELDNVAKMPGRVELLGQIVSLALGPGATLVALVKGPGSTIAGQIKALEEKLEKAD